MKKEIRIACFDDGPFEKNKSKYSHVIGVVIRGNDEIDGILHFKVKVDGLDATRKLIKVVKKSKFYDELKAIFLDGIAFGGFNVIDIEKVYRETSLPVVCLMRKKPNFKAIYKALKKLDNFEERLKMIKKAGKVRKMRYKNGEIFYQFIGEEENKVREMIKVSIRKGFVPEGLRIAHLIATAIKLGESRGRA